MTDRLLIIFVKNPILGQVKTRLAATIGEVAALQIYHKLLKHTEVITQDLPFDKVVYYSNFIDELDSWDNTIYHKRLQHPGDLGQRMALAFQWGFQSGYNEICIIGSDCIELTSEIILGGFELLSTNDSVLGPTRDGGYYLLGLKKVRTELFKNKNWGTYSVAANTLADLKKIGLSNGILELLNDVDVEKDLPDTLRIWNP